ncbi:MAG: CoA transferase [candidate division NC10 bacterium]|nr:CoA transferase [candidate division NC10 bacterium]
MSSTADRDAGKEAGLPLAGIRVVDLSHIVAGPFMGAILADFGAEVIKIEPPGKGDRAREVAPFVERGNARVSGFFATVNRNRRGVVLDLKSAPGKEAFQKLVGVSDVLIENFAPGTMQRLGLEYEVLRHINPRLIYVAISGFGQLEPYVGPWSSRPANNATAQAMSGLMDLSGDPEGPPAFIGQAIGDTIPGLWAVIGTLLALEHRRRTGLGQFIDVAMYDSLAAMCFNAISDYHVSGVAPGRGMAWRETFSDRLECADGYIAVSLWGTVRERWQRLWPLIGHPEMLTHPEFDPAHPGCPTCFPIVKSVLEKWLTATTREEAVRLLLDLGFSAGPVQGVKEVYECEQLQRRQLFIEIEDGLGGIIRTVGTPVKFSGIQPLAPQRAPFLGEHTREVLAELLGLTEGELDRLGLQPDSRPA